MGILKKALEFLAHPDPRGNLGLYLVELESAWATRLQGLNDKMNILNLKQKGINFKFSTSNGRGKDIEYYSSFIFSIEVGLKNSIKTLVQGGRYNDLTSKILGLKKIPAVGAAINL